MKLFIFLTKIIIIILLVISCKKGNKGTLLKNKKIAILSYKYSDTISNNMVGKGKIIYNLKYEGVPSNIFERRIHLYVSTDLDNPASNFEEIENSVQWVFFDTIGNGIFDFQFEYKNSGIKTLNLAFEDLIFFGDSLQYKDTILNVKQTLLALPVFVVDSSSVLGSKNNNIYFEQEDVFKIKRKDSAIILREAQQKIDSMKRILNN